MEQSSCIERVGERVLRLHGLIYKKTGGRVGHQLPGIPPSLMLHTTGAKTGQPRTNTLTYARDGDDYVVVASLGGAPRSPGWYHNLRAHPEVAINIGTRRLLVTARALLPDDPDYLRLWEMVNKKNAHRYDGYQDRTSRAIPIVKLTP